MNKNIIRINESLEPIRQEIINHKLYSVISNIEDLRVFMEYHVYAVFDFMSLLKALQNSLTCSTIPWVPVGLGGTRYLINEIVVGEESDLDVNGNRKSHFEMYLDAMIQSDANVKNIQSLVSQIKKGLHIKDAILYGDVPQKAQDFMRFTFDVIKCNKPHLTASVFTFGRENLIPSMFHSIVSDIDKINPNRISVFKYYLDRHIEVDSGHHSLLALQMLESLCGDDDRLWEESQEIAFFALRERLQLWDAIYTALQNK